MPLVIIAAALLVLVVGLNRPARSVPLFAFIAMIAPVQAYVELGSSLPIITVHRAMIAALILVYLFRPRPARTNVARSIPFRSLIVLSAIILFLSSVMSVDTGLSLKKWVGIVVEFYTLYFLLINFIETRAQVIATIQAIVLAVGMAACIGVIQSYTQWSPVDYLPSPSREILDYQPVPDLIRGYRPISVFPHPILLGAGIAMGLPLALVATALSTARSMKLLILSLMPVMALCLYKTMSRGAWLAALLAALVLYNFSSRAVKRGIVIGGSVCLVVLLMLPDIGQTLFYLYNETFDLRNPLSWNFYYRLHLVSVAFEALRHDLMRALFGYGWNTLNSLNLSGYFLGSYETFESWDNSWAAIAVSGGILGFLSMILLLGKITVFTFGEVKRTKGAERDIFAAVLAAIVAFLFLMTNVAIYGWAQFCYLFWVLVSLSVALSRAAPDPCPEPDRQGASLRPAGGRAVNPRGHSRGLDARSPGPGSWPQPCPCPAGRSHLKSRAGGGIRLAGRKSG